jgi:hypothetical protein
MKLWITYFIVFGLGFTSFALMLTKAPLQEKLMLGDWKEMKWEYEKNDEGIDTAISDKKALDLKEFAGEKFLVHKAETWRFNPDGTMLVEVDGKTEEVEWRVKGRGHILQLRHGSEFEENYNITELESNKLVLNFECEAKTRGIAKLTFEKISE